MKILAMDTATPSCSVAIVEDKRFLAEITTESKETHSKRLMPMIRSVLVLSGLSPEDIAGFAVNIGPGSFTGLRIGVSTAKGLAAAARKPVAGVRTSDALAYQFPYADRFICTMTDARKGQVYFAGFRFTGNRMIKEQDDQVLYPEDAVARISEPCLFVGTGAVLYQSLIMEKLKHDAIFVPSHLNVLRASSLAMISLERFANTDTDDPANLTPFYIRESDAKVQG